MAGTVRLLRTFVWLHWRQQLNALQAGRRSAASRASAWIQVLAQVVVALLFTGLAGGLALGAFFAGTTLVGGGEARDMVLVVLRILLGFFTFLVLFLPLIRASQGTLPGTGRLLLLPIPRRTLHALETATYLTDPWLLVILPAFVTLAIPVLAESVAGGLVILGGGLSFFALLGLLASALSYGIRILLRDRKRAEAVALLLFLVLMALSFLPALFEARSEGDRTPGTVPAATEASETAVEETPAAPGSAPESGFAGADVFPRPLQVLPSEAFSRIAALASAGESPATTVSFVPLGLVGLAVWGVSRRLWGRLMSTPGAASGPRGARGLPRLPSWPAVSAGTVAVALTFARTTLRTVQGKLVVVMPTAVIVVLSVLGEAETGPWGGLFGGPSLVLAAAFFGVSALQNILLNLFGIDGSGLSLQLLQPLTSRQIVRGKALGGWLLVSLTVVPALLAAVLLGSGLSPWLAPAGYLAAVATYLLFLPVAAWLSILFPKAANLSKMGSEGKPHGGAALVGFVSLVLLFTLPAAAGFAGLYLAGPAGALAAQGALFLVSTVLFVVFSNSAAGLLDLRREGVHLAIREG